MFTEIRILHVEPVRVADGDPCAVRVNFDGQGLLR